MRVRWQGLTIAGVLVIAAALRLWGIRWGLPDQTHLFSYHPDEFHSLRGILSLSQGDLNPHFFNYGSLYLYLVAAMCTLLHGGLVAGLDVGTLSEAIRAFTLDARLVSVLAGVATVYVTYLIGARVASPRAGLVAAAALSVMPLHVLNCHYGTVDVTQSLFIALCLYFAVKITEGGTLKGWVWAGAMAGLAASVKYSGVVVIVAPVVAGLVRQGKGGENVRDDGGGNDGDGHGGIWVPIMAGIGGCLLAALAAFAVTSPYTFLAWDEAKQGILFELQHAREGEALAMAVWPNGWLFHLQGAVWLVPLAMALSAGRTKRALTPVLAFTAVWYVVTSLAKVRYARYDLPVEAVGAVALAVVARAFGRRLDRRLMRGLAWAVAAATALSLLATTASRDGAMSGPTTQDKMLAVILAQVPPGQSVGMVHEPWFDMPPVDYCNGGEVLRRNPLWAQFKRPERPIVVTGMDAERILAGKPYAFVVSDLELGPAMRRADPAAEKVWQALTMRGVYRSSPYTVSAWPDNGLIPSSMPTDTRYACPRLWLFIRNETD